MWPFSKKEDSKEDNYLRDSTAKLKAFRDIGETFNYLGRTCIVTGHMELIPSTYEFIPLLKFDYCDDHGVVHSKNAYLIELPGLINQQISE